VSRLAMTVETTGERPASEPMEVRNKGRGPLYLTVVPPRHNPPFSFDITSFSVAPNSARTVTVRFAPIKKGTTRDEIKIQSADPRKEFVVFLTGKSK